MDFVKIIKKSAPIIFAGLVGIAQAINEQKEAEKIEGMEKRIAELEKGK